MNRLSLNTNIDFKHGEVIGCKIVLPLHAAGGQFVAPRWSQNEYACTRTAESMVCGRRATHLDEWLHNLLISTEQMLDHLLLQTHLFAVAFSEAIIKRTNPGLLYMSRKMESPHANVHGFRTIAELFAALNPTEHSVLYRGALKAIRGLRRMCEALKKLSVDARESAGRPIGQVLRQLCIQLLDYTEFLSIMVPAHDDIIDFFYEALPGYKTVGQRRILLGSWGCFHNPEVCDYEYRNMSYWGGQMYITPGVVVDGTLRTTDLTEINLNIRLLEDIASPKSSFVRVDPLGNTVDDEHPWNQRSESHSLISPRWYDSVSDRYLALDDGGGPLGALWTTALAAKVDIGYIKAWGRGIVMCLPRAVGPEMVCEWKIPPWSNALERIRARTYFSAYGAAFASYSLSRITTELRKTVNKPIYKALQDSDNCMGCGLHQGSSGMISEHITFREGRKHKYILPPTLWAANSTDRFNTPGPCEDAVKNTPIFEENIQSSFLGIDIFRVLYSLETSGLWNLVVINGGKTVKSIKSQEPAKFIGKKMAGKDSYSIVGDQL